MTSLFERQKKASEAENYHAYQDMLEAQYSNQQVVTPIVPLTPPFEQYREMQDRMDAEVATQQRRKKFPQETQLMTDFIPMRVPLTNQEQLQADQDWEELRSKLTLYSGTTIVPESVPLPTIREPVMIIFPEPVQVTN